MSFLNLIRRIINRNQQATAVQSITTPAVRSYGSELNTAQPGQEPPPRRAGDLSPTNSPAATLYHPAVYRPAINATVPLLPSEQLSVSQRTIVAENTDISGHTISDVADVATGPLSTLNMPQATVVTFDSGLKQAIGLETTDTGATIQATYYQPEGETFWVSETEGEHLQALGISLRDLDERVIGQILGGHEETTIYTLDNGAALASSVTDVPQQDGSVHKQTNLFFRPGEDMDYIPVSDTLRALGTDENTIANARLYSAQLGNQPGVKVIITDEYGVERIQHFTQPAPGNVQVASLLSTGQFSQHEGLSALTADSASSQQPVMEEVTTTVSDRVLRWATEENYQARFFADGSTLEERRNALLTGLAMGTVGGGVLVAAPQVGIPLVLGALSLGTAGCDLEEIANGTATPFDDMRNGGGEERSSSGASSAAPSSNGAGSFDSSRGSSRGAGYVGPVQIDRAVAALIGPESGWDSTIPNGSGSGAIGLGQIMPENVGPWTQRHLGYTMSYDEFRYDPEAQKKVIYGQVNLILQDALADGETTEEGMLRYLGNVWYSGQPYPSFANTQQYWNGNEYPSPNQYTNTLLNSYQTTPSPSQNAATPPPPSPQPEPAPVPPPVVTQPVAPPPVTTTPPVHMDKVVPLAEDTAPPTYYSDPGVQESSTNQNQERQICENATSTDQLNRCVEEGHITREEAWKIAPANGLVGN